MAKHPHHPRSPHIRGRACSGPVMGSEALGFYLVSRDGEHVPICEIHSYGASATNEAWHNILYTGPGKKSITAIKHKRTIEDDELFDLKHFAQDHNDIASSRRERKTGMSNGGPNLGMYLPVSTAAKCFKPIFSLRWETIRTSCLCSGLYGQTDWRWHPFILLSVRNGRCYLETSVRLIVSFMSRRDCRASGLCTEAMRDLIFHRLRHR